jgi:hypothetical protein
MREDPAFLFYPKDFLMGTQFLTFDELGKWIKILCSLHQLGHLKREQIVGICQGNATASIWDMLKIDKDGKYYSSRLDEEIAKRQKFSENQSIRAKKRWSDKSHGNATAMPKIENANANGNVNESLKGKMYKSEDFAELPEQYIQSSIERLKIQKNISVNSLQISQMWSIFKSQNLAGDKWYNSEADVYRHFSNWIKNQTFKNETDQRTTKAGRNSGTYELLEKLRSEYGGDFGQV